MFRCPLCRQIMDRPVKEILIIRTDRFGEFLLITPALRALKETFGGARITAVVHPAVVGLAGCIPYIDKVFPWDPSCSTALQRVAFVKALRRNRIELAVVFNPSKEFHLITFLSGIPLRLGYSRKWGFLLTHRMEDTKDRGDRHEIDSNLDLVGSVGASTKDKTLTLRWDDGIMSCDLPQVQPDKPQGPFIAVHPFTSDPVKQWPYERFKELVSRLPEELHARVVIVGGMEEAGRQAALLADPAMSGAVDMVGKTTLPQLAGLLRQCDLLVSGDSGPVHLAGSVGIPVVALFRSDLPGKTKQRWGPVSSASQVLEASSLAEISVDSVIAMCRKVLGV